MKSSDEFIVDDSKSFLFYFIIFLFLVVIFYNDHFTPIGKDYM